MDGNFRYALLLIVALGLVPAAVAVTCGNEHPAVPATTPGTDFADNGDGTVTHTRTGLMWMRCSLGQTWDGSACSGTAGVYTWQQALRAAVDLNAGGGYADHVDWRLPNKNELESIVEERCWSPAINAAVFPGTPANSWYWSSTPDAGNAGYAWNVYFGEGNVYTDGKGYSDHARLVRFGE